MTALTFAAFAASANVVGALAVAWHERRSMRVLDALIAISAGFMISVALVELVPSALERGDRSVAAFVMLGGYLLYTSRNTRSPSISISVMRRIT
jgi:zinc transporter ZupT